LLLSGGAHFHGFFTGVETLGSRDLRTKAITRRMSGAITICGGKAMSLTDCRGVPVSTQSRALLQQYERAVDLTAGYFADPFATIQAALDEDPAFAAGHCLRAGLIVTATDRNLVPVLAESIQAV